MALEMQNFEALSPPVVKKITWWTLVYISPIVLEVRGFAIRGHVFPPTNRELAGLPVHYK